MYLSFPDNTPTAGLVKSRINITQNIARQVKNQAHVRRYFLTSIGINRYYPEWRSVKGLMSKNLPHRQEGTYEFQDAALDEKENKNCL